MIKIKKNTVKYFIWNILFLYSILNIYFMILIIIVNNSGSSPGKAWSNLLFALNPEQLGI